jgi:catechol 2,3-dioxygenase-like lactoylglutathione lyase family enzyme
MLQDRPLIAFVGVSDLDRAGQFYGRTLGLPLTDESPFALVADAHGTMLRLTAVEQPAAAPTSPGMRGWNRTSAVSGPRRQERRSRGFSIQTATTCP